MNTNTTTIVTEWDESKLVGMQPTTIDELTFLGYKPDHMAITSGYIRRCKDNPVVVINRYKGLFGEGYTVETASWISTCYHPKEYWLPANR